MISINGKSLYDIEGYEKYEKPTKQAWYRNPLTGKLYKENIPGKVVTYHLFALVTDDFWYNELFKVYELRESVKLNINGEEVECIITEDELRLKKESENLYSGTIAFEEIQAK